MLNFGATSLISLIWIECFFAKLVFQSHILFQEYLISLAFFYVIPFRFYSTSASLRWERKKLQLDSEGMTSHTRLSNSACQYSCVCDVNSSVSFGPTRFRLHCELHQWCQSVANGILIKSVDGITALTFRGPVVSNLYVPTVLTLRNSVLCP